MDNCPYPAPRRVDVRRQLDQDWLLWWLDRYRVRFQHLDAVGWAIQGRPQTDLDKIISRLKAQTAALYASDLAPVSWPGQSPGTHQRPDLRPPGPSSGGRPPVQPPRGASPARPAPGAARYGSRDAAQGGTGAGRGSYRDGSTSTAGRGKAKAPGETGAKVDVDGIPPPSDDDFR
jgi:hypothetical protein